MGRTLSLVLVAFFLSLWYGVLGLTYPSLWEPMCRTQTHICSQTYGAYTQKYTRSSQYQRSYIYIHIEIYKNIYIYICVCVIVCVCVCVVRWMLSLVGGCTRTHPLTTYTSPRTISLTCLCLLFSIISFYSCLHLTPYTIFTSFFFNFEDKKW